MPTSTGKILVVTWNGGGNVPPALSLADELRRRGHDVRVLGHGPQRATVEGAALRFEASQHAAPHSPLDRAGFARFAAEHVRLYVDPGARVDLMAALDREGADVVVVDALLLDALRALQRRGTRHVVLHHTLLGYMTGGFAAGAGTITRMRGLAPTTLWGRADRVLAPGTASLERQSSQPANVRLTGPMWPVGVSPRPHQGKDRILVSLSSIHYGGQVAALRRIMAAVAGLPVPVVLTTGRAVDPA